MLNFHLLDEIIDLFDNNTIICGSLCDLYYIDYAGPIADFDLIIEKNLFLEKLEIKELSKKIESKGFKLLIKAPQAQLYKRVSYIGTYKNESYVDIFLTDDSDTILDHYNNIQSKFFFSSSKYKYYKMHTADTRKKRLNELLNIINTLDNPNEDWVVAWRTKKRTQIENKLPIYNEKYL